MFPGLVLEYEKWEVLGQDSGFVPGRSSHG